MSSLVRKTFWPGAIAIGFLIFLGAIGLGRTTNAQVFSDDIFPGDLCAIYGPEIITEDGTYLYVGVIADDDELKPSALTSTTRAATATSLAASKPKTATAPTRKSTQPTQWLA